MGNYGADDNGPSQEELESARIRSAGGKVIREHSDVPKCKHYVIFWYYNSSIMKYTTYIDRAQWLTEVRRMAAAREQFTAFEAGAPVKTSVRIDVDVET